MMCKIYEEMIEKNKPSFFRFLIDLRGVMAIERIPLLLGHLVSTIHFI